MSGWLDACHVLFDTVSKQVVVVSDNGLVLLGCVASFGVQSNGGGGKERVLLKRAQSEFIGCDYLEAVVCGAGDLKLCWIASKASSCSFDVLFPFSRDSCIP